MIFRKSLSWLAAPALLVSGTVAAAQDSVSEPSAAVPQQSALEARADQVIDFLNGKTPPEAIFSDGFLAAVPPAQLAALVKQITAQNGAAVAVESLDPPQGPRATISVRLEKAMVSGVIGIDPAQDNRISELLFQDIAPLEDSPEKISADLAALPGVTNALFARLDRLDQPVFAHNSDQSQALGSTFKLYVLSALSKAISQGAHDWDEVIRLEQVSFPSGQMQDWPIGSPVTLHTLATLMISISDNTATDQLISFLGREAVEAELLASGNSDPSRTIPLLKTRELFAMRGVSDGFIDAYREASDADQRAILAKLKEDDVSIEQIQQTFASDVPGAIDIEWFASPRDLAGLLDRIAKRGDETALAIMNVRPQLSERELANWAYAGFKGGSEPGVLNLTWLLRDTDGASWIMTAGWNNPDASIETSTLRAIAQRIMALKP